MSYTDDFWKALEEEEKKKKKKSGNTTITQSSTKSSGDKFTDEFLEALNKKSAEIDNSFRKTSGRFSDDEDIAPVREDSKGLDFFDAGSFSDGFDWYDPFVSAGATIGDLAMGATKGLSGLAEGVTDLLLYGGSGVASLFGADEAAHSLKEAAKYSFTDDVFSPFQRQLDKDSLLGETSVGVAEGLGYTLGIAATAGLGEVAGLSGAGLSALTTGATFASGAGSGMSEAYNSGKDVSDLDAVTYGVMKGAVEAGTEMLFGGIGKGVKAVGLSHGIGGIDDMIANKLTQKLTNQTVKSLAKFGIKSAGEGVEEVLAGLGTAVAKKLTYMSEEDLGKLVEDENLLESFVVGTLSSAISQSGVITGMTHGSLKESIQTGRDFVTGNTQNEQTVIDKIVEDRIAEAEKNDEKLSHNDKGKIQDEVVRDMERGYIGTDTIEEILGGDSYKSYKDTLAREEAIKEEFETLKGKQNATLEEQARFREVRREYYRNQSEKGKARLTELKNKMSQDVFNMVKGDRLAESYREKARVGEDFKADLTKYKGAKHEEAAKKTIENAMKAGANNTNRVHDLVDMAAELSAETGFVYDFQDDEQIKNGFIEQKTGELEKLEAIENRTDAQNEKITKLKDLITKVQNNEVTVNGNVDSNGIVLNLDSAKPLNRIIGHEITHTVEKAKHYEKLRDSLFEYAKSKGVDIDAELEMKALEYEGVEGTTAEAELVADLVGDYLFTDSDYVRDLSTKNRNLAQRIYDEVKYFLTKATTGSKEERELLKVKHEFEKAFRESAEKNTAISGVKNAIESKTQPGKLDPRTVTKSDVVGMLRKVEEGVISGNTYIPVRIGTPRKLIYWAEKRRGDVIDNNPIAISADKAFNAMNRSGESESGRPNMLSTDEIVSMIESMNDPQYIVYQSANDRYVEVVKFDTKTGDKAFAVIEIGNNKDAVYMNGYEGGLYNILVTTYPPKSGKLRELLNTPSNKVIYDKNKDASQRTSGSNVPSVLNDASFYEDSIPDNGKSVNGQFSLSDSNGKTLSNEQAEFFKDSKARDENGNLKVVYHGTRKADFTVFKQNATYFTDNKEMADSYSPNGDMYEGYVNINKPYEIDAKGEKWSKIPIDDATKKFLQEYGSSVFKEGGKWRTTPADIVSAIEEAVDNGDMDYDGIIIRNIDDTGSYYKGKDSHLATDYIVFNSNQFKNADNKKPTSNPDIRFSLSKAVEETKDLVAVHNLQSRELFKTIELGGLAMPSIAVIKAQQGHEKYGDVSLIFPKDTIDPKANSANKVYGGDAWTPTHPRIEYKPSEEVQKRIRDKYYELAEKFGYDDLRPLYRYVSELEGALNAEGGEAGLLEWLYNDDRIMQLYLQDSGKGKVEPVIKETRTEATETEKEMNQWFIDKLGEDVIRAYKAPAGVSPFAHRAEFMEQHGEEVKQAYRDFFAEKFGFDEDTLGGIIEKTQSKDLASFLRNAYVYLADGGVTVKTETDYKATEKAIREKSADGYKEWVDSLFKGVEERTGIRNNLDAYTRSGDRRSWDALHWENTLENVVRAMKAQDQTGADAFSPASAIFAVAHKQYDSIADIKADSDRLGRVSEEEYKALEESYASRLIKIAESIKDPSERNPFIASDRAASEIIDAVRSQKTKTGMLRYMQKWNKRVTETTVDDIVSLVNDIANMPTGYFEAKPQRAVGLEEVGVFVIPRNADVKLKQELLNRGYNIAEYDPDVEGDRQKVVNQFEEYQFSLSDAGKEFAPIGKNDFFGKDFRTKSADEIAAEEDIAPVVTDTNVGGKTVNTPVETVDEAPVTETVDAESVMMDRDSFVSQQAMELYKEITSLKKGVRASQRLGYLLDHGHEWRSIKTALLNIRDNPNQVVNPNSAAETVAREMLGREYEDMVYELSEQSDVAGNIRTKMQHIQTEIANNEKLRDQSNADYDTEIAEVQAEYDAKKNKNTIVANDLLRRIERLKRMKSTNEANYTKRISDLEARIEKMSKPEYKRAVQRKAKHEEYTKLMENLVGDTSTWVDKKLGISYKVNTLRRNLRDVVRDANGKQDIAKADAIYDELQGKYNHNEAELKRESRRIKAVFAEMKLNHAEDTYAHMLGEFQSNPDSKLTEETVKEFYEKNKGKIDTEKVDKAIEEARKTFDELIVRVNERLKEQGMKEIPYRKGYFPHFTNPKQGWLAKLLNWKTVDTEIPTSIAGLTETFNPERSWQGFSKQRKADTTDYSLEQGLDTYIHGALDWIYHIEDIQKRRALENHIRYIHSEEGVKAKVDAIRNSEELDADEAQQQIDAVYAEANNPLNNFVTNLRAGTNTLANKKSENDRQIESDTNRKVYSVMTNLNNRINANMVVGSFSSALTNFIPITQSWMEVSPVNSLRGMKDTIKSTIRDDGIVSKSDFLTNRLLNEENLYQTTWDKVSEKAALMMEAIDSFTSQTVWRSKYLQNMSEGMSETEAIKNADQFAENVIAGRSRGNMPTIFDAKNPITKLFTAFQLEVSNQYGYMFKDAPQDSKNKARLIKGYATAFLGAYAYNALYSSLVGREAAFDPIGILEDLFRDMGLFGDDEEEEPEDIILNLTENVLQEVPFVSGMVGGGRVPISSALPYSGEYGGLDALLNDISDGNAESITKEMLKPLYYLALPVGGGQIKKTVEGLSMFSDEHPVAGSYTDSGNLRFPVEDTFGNRLQAGLFGQYASENARDYFDNGRSPLKEKQIQEYMDVDIPIRDYWDYREGLAEQKTIEDKFDYIAGLDLPVAKKNILINNAVDREESVDLEGYEDFSSYDEFDFATKNPGKYAVSQVVGGYDSYVSYMDALGDIEADKDEDGKSISGSKKEKVAAYINNLDIDYGMKIILYKSMYDSKEDRNNYNADIVAYLDSREDISYDEMVTILTELGMRVSGNNVYWD